MHRLRLLYAHCFGRSTGLASSAQSTANLGLGGNPAWLPPLSSSHANLLLSIGNNSELGIGVLRVRVDPEAFSQGEPVWMTDDYLSARGISSAPDAQPSPIA